jgi:regulator of PEP synthase PpsR (kinase-PPPase family)
VQAAAEHALLVHTLVDSELRGLLLAEAAARDVATVDLIGPLLDELTARLGEEPLGHPGRYRATRNGYFKRIEAMEFAVNHDDGQRIAELGQAEIVLLGVSRVGKTPLSIYLSLQGWKVANLPMVMGIAPPEELLQVDPAKVVGLMIEPQQLLIFRRARQKSLGIPEGSYVDRIRVAEELRAANHFFARQGYAVIDVTDKPIETSSEEVISLITERILQT